MEQLKHTLFSADPINLQGSDSDYSITTDIRESYLTESKTRIDERLDNLYDIVERLEYRVVELENKVKELDSSSILEIDAGYIKI